MRDVIAISTTTRGGMRALWMLVLALVLVACSTSTEPARANVESWTLTFSGTGGLAWLTNAVQPHPVVDSIRCTLSITTNMAVTESGDLQAHYIENYDLTCTPRGSSYANGPFRVFATWQDSTRVLVEVSNSRLLMWGRARSTLDGTGDRRLVTGAGGLWLETAYGVRLFSGTFNMQRWGAAN